VETTEAAAQAAAERAAQAREDEQVEARHLASIRAVLSTKETVRAAAEAAEPSLRSASASARASLQEALAGSADAEEALTIAPDDPAAQAAQQHAADTLAGATATAHLAEAELAKAEVATRSAQTALSLWRERIEAHVSEHSALQTQATEAELVAANARATATDASHQLTALQGRHAEADAALGQASSALDAALNEQTHHTVLLESARPAWEALRAHLAQSGGRVQRAESAEPAGEPSL